MSVDRVKAELERAEAMVADLRERLAAAESEAGELRIALSVLERLGPAPTETSGATPSTPADVDAAPSPSAPATLPQDSPYYGKGINEAAFIALSLGGREMTPAEVVADMRKAGFEFTATNPAHSVYWALRNRARKVGDVIALRNGRWALAANVEDSEFSKKVRQGLDAAARRGVRLGAPQKYTDEQIALAQGLLDSGVSVPEVAKRLGITKPVIYKRCRIERRQKPAEKASATPEPKPSGILH